MERFFKNLKAKSASSVQDANAILYPNKILIATIDKVKEGFGISSSKITFLPIDSELELLGKTLRHHLSLTEIDLPIPDDYKKHYADFLKAAGFKNAKEHHKDALLLMVGQKDNIITIQPTKNGGATGRNRGFLGFKCPNIILDAIINDSELGEKIRFAWTKCEIVPQ